MRSLLVCSRDPLFLTTICIFSGRCDRSDLVYNYRGTRTNLFMAAQDERVWGADVDAFRVRDPAPYARSSP